MMQPSRIPCIAFQESRTSPIPSVSIWQLMDKTQARIAETEKYAHVTFFFNGGVEAAKQRRGPYPCKIPESCNLRSAARDERIRSV